MTGNGGAFCQHCGKRTDDGARFCSSCGTALSPPPPAPENGRKCPSCGAGASAMTVQCPYCGHELGGSGVPGGVAAFFERLDALDQQLFEAEAAKEVTRPGGAFGAMSGFAGVAKTLTGTSAGDKRKLEMIQNFPIPNSREDILASSRITSGPGIFTAINIADHGKSSGAYLR